MVSKPQNIVAFIHSWCEEKDASLRVTDHPAEPKQPLENAEDEDDGLYSDNDAEGKDEKGKSLDEASAEAERLGELPPGWEEAIDEDGDTYYINHNDETASLIAGVVVYCTTVMIIGFR